MKKTRINMIFAFSVLSALVTACAFAFFLHVIRNKNEHSSNVLSTLSEKIAEKDNADLVTKKIAETEVVRNALQVHFVDTNTINKFVDYLESFGAETHTEISVKDVRIPTDNAQAVAVTVSIRGAFADVLQTIALLESDAYVIHITSTYINKDLQVVPPTEPGKTPPPEKPGTWQADVSFVALSS